MPPPHWPTLATHELMHAIDWAMGTEGRQFSDGREWRELFEATQRQPDARRAFPTDRSRVDPNEFFAECQGHSVGILFHQAPPLRERGLMPDRSPSWANGDLPALDHTTPRDEANVTALA